MPTIISTAVVSNPTVSGEIALVRGADFATATVLFSATAANQPLLSVLASQSSNEFVSSVELDGAVGISFIGETGARLFIRKADGTELKDATFVTEVTSGTVTRSRSDASSAGFLAGVAVGITLGSK